MLCDTEVKSLDYYFYSVQNSVDMVTAYAEEDLQGVDDEQLQQHVENMRQYLEWVEMNSLLSFKTMIITTWTSLSHSLIEGWRPTISWLKILGIRFSCQKDLLFIILHLISRSQP